MGGEDWQLFILSFHVDELRELLEFAGKGKIGMKKELQSRALSLLKLNSPIIHQKIYQLHLRRFDPTGRWENRPSACPTRSSMIPVVSTSQYPFPNTSTSDVNKRSSSVNDASSLQNIQLSKQLLPPKSKTRDDHIVKFKELPFYDILHDIIKPTILRAAVGKNSGQSAFHFLLTPQQIDEILNSKIECEGKDDFGTQIQLRFCVFDTTSEQDDKFPSDFSVEINEKLVTLPNLIQSSRPNVPPKRPSCPLDVTRYVKLTQQRNIMKINWTSEGSPPPKYCFILSLVKRLNSDILMTRLRAKGTRNPFHTRALIKEKFHDSEIAMTNLRGSLLCPIGKKRMIEPCRPTTCTHLQCFDAELFIKMNEKKPRWICPVCDKPALFRTLAIDGLFAEIYANTPVSCTEVQFLGDGKWTPITDDKAINAASNVVDDNQIIDDSGNKVVKTEQVEIVVIGDNDPQ